MIASIAKAYEDTEGSLADRLMAALVAGDCAGGDHRGRLAAGIRVAKRGVDGYWLELYTDKSQDAVVDLLRKYAELQHEAKGAWRGGQLPFQHPCPDRPVPRAVIRTQPVAATKLVEPGANGDGARFIRDTALGPRR